MSALITIARPGMLYGARPERREAEAVSTSDRRLQHLMSVCSGKTTSFAGFVDTLERINAAVQSIDVLDDAAFAAHTQRLRLAMQQQGLSAEHAEQVFAAIKVAVRRTLGLDLHAEQLYAAWVMLHGAVAEMSTGEGKTLTAALPAITVALTGTPVHVITVNEYLVNRDVNRLVQLYAQFGLRVSEVTDQMNDESRRHAYAADIVYCTNKQVVFDYLRDLQVLGGERMGLKSQLRSLLASQPALPVMRGLCFAVVDEADSVMIDDARTPLILSAPWETDRAAVTEATVALGIARTLHEGADYRVQLDSRNVRLTHTGLDALRSVADRLDGVWRFERYRSELVRQALTALHVFRIDRDYLVRDGRVELIDESTGRVMPDRKLRHGLHRMLEIKERCDVTEDSDVIAAISFQQFFTRYCHLAGMSGTVHEVADELRRVYDVDVVRIPPHRPGCRRVLPMIMARDRSAQLHLAINEVRGRHATGQPVLIGTRSVELSEHVSDLLTEQGIEHTLLNARQDADEAAIVAEAGRPGAVTVATNMAGRGTDIPLGANAIELGGLHVMNLEVNESIRIDRQLFGRAARQGDPGSCQSLLSLKDELLVNAVPARMLALLTWALEQWPSVSQRILPWVVRFAQRRLERDHAKQRITVFYGYDQLKRQLAISGDQE